MYTENAILDSVNDVSLMSRTEILEMLAPLVGPLSHFEDLVDKEERLGKQRQSRRGWSDFGLLVGVAVFIIIPTMAFFLLNFNVLIENPPAFSFILWAAVLVLPAASYLLYGIPVSNNKKKKIDEHWISECEKIKQEQINTIAPWWNQIVAFVPPSYRYSFAVDRFCFYFSNGRAENLKEALNLYEEELHRSRMENMQAQIVHYQKYQSQMAAVSAMANVTTAYNTARVASSFSEI